MKVHYFQRYHAQENVATANAMLLLSRLYFFSPEKFFSFLAQILPEKANVELVFDMQTKTKDGTILDAAITQSSFKLAVETKLYGNFVRDQLTGHLSSFRNENYKVLLTLDPRPIDKKLQSWIDQEICERNEQTQSNIVHKHLTFEELISGIIDVIDERDYDLKDILEDYREYCYRDNLIPDDWKRMRVQLASTTIDYNITAGLYYDDVYRGFSGHDYLGLYNKKAVRAIGKITDIVTAAFENDNLVIKDTTKGEITDEKKQRIKKTIEDAKREFKHDLSGDTRYFFVECFIETCFEKETKYAPRGTRIFDLCEVLGVDKLPETSQIAEKLYEKKWR